MIKNYRKFNASDAYYLGLQKGELLYVVEVPELMPRWINVDYTSHSKGYKRKIDLDIIASERDKLIEKNLFFVTTMDELRSQGQDNQGHDFESLMWKHFGLEGYDSDKIGFWHDGDITVNNIKYQLKMNHAQIVKEDTLEILKTFKRLGVTPPETFPKGIKNKVEKLKAEKKKARV
jgi:hypothetical protein